jgi:hypothetical protein
MDMETSEVRHRRREFDALHSWVLLSGGPVANLEGGLAHGVWGCGVRFVSGEGLDSEWSCDQILRQSSMERVGEVVLLGGFLG